MKKLIIIAVTFLFSHSLYADEFYNALLGVCDTENNTFEVNYFGAYNEEGSAMRREVQAKTQKECVIGDDQYTLLPRFYYGSPDFRGRCGSHQYVEIQIFKNEESIFKRVVESDCHLSESYISSVLVETNPENVSIIKKEGKTYQFNNK